MPTEILTFHGKPILKIVSPDDERIKIQFGQKKANLVLQFIDEITKFAYTSQAPIESLPAESKEG